ncbi:hypothetical protein ABBQ32_004678 [Trebouxia sp. C0010 RCD-2024]
MDRSPQDAPGPSTATAAGTPQQLIEQLSQLIVLLQKGHGNLPGFDELWTRQRTEEQLTQELHGAQQQQREHEKWVAQELLLAQLAQQLAIYAQDLHHLRGICQHQDSRVSAVQQHAAQLEQQLGQKHHRIEQLEQDSTARDQHIVDLEVRLHKYRSLCAYVTTSAQEIEGQDDPRRNCAVPAKAGLLSATIAETTAQGSSGALSGSDMMSDPGSSQQFLPHRSSLEADQSMDTGQHQSASGMQELKNTPWLKRMPCLIIGRHPHAPREVPVVCKQITGSLLLGNVREELRIKPNSPQTPAVLSPSEFEAAAGCSKGKNWKANIRVVGSNGCTQMLKIWLPGLMQLVGDHAKVAIADVDISTLLDAESGLRIQSDI